MDSTDRPVLYPLVSYIDYDVFPGIDLILR